MIARSVRALLRACVLVILISAGNSAVGNTFVRIDYNLSISDHHLRTVFVETFDDRPLTSDNFLMYVEGGLYDGTLAHRLAISSSLQVLQGGGFFPDVITLPPPLNVAIDPTRRVDLDGNPLTPNPTVDNEFNNSPARSNVRATIAMAKVANNPDSATNQFFFNLADNAANLDNQNGGFAVFAQVVGNGMTYLDMVGDLPVINLNPDDNGNGLRDTGPFTTVPFLGSRLLVLERARVVDLFQDGSMNNVSSPLAVNSETFIEAGAEFSGNSNISVGLGGILGLQDAANVDVAVINGGRVEPGLDLGAASVASYEQLSTGTLAIELHETTPGTEHDQLNTPGSAILDGALDVTLLANFAPAPGDAFTILTAAGGVTGEFNLLTLPLLDLGSVWDLAIGSTDVTLTPVYADYNQDGIADAADYSVWRDSFGETVDPFTGADGSGNGLIDDADYVVWQQNLGNTQGTISASGAASAVVPEPATALSLVLAGLLILLFSRTTRRV